MKLRTTLLFVENIEKSTLWYSLFFKQDPVEKLDNFASFLLEDGLYFNLHPADQKSPLSTGGCVPYFWVNNFCLYRDRAIGLGALMWRGPLDVRENNTRICQLKDPYGNVFGLEAPLL